MPGRGRRRGHTASKLRKSVSAPVQKNGFLESVLFAEKYPKLRVVGFYRPLFRALSDEGDQDVVRHMQACRKTVQSIRT
jgi:hypothetical protein